MAATTEPGALEGDDVAPARVTWAARAQAIGARPVEPAAGAAALAAIWGADRHFARLGAAEREGLVAGLVFSEVPPASVVIAQDEPGDYLLIVLTGGLTVELAPPTGPQVRLSRSGPGDIIGEMSVLDAGTRFSTCTTTRVTQVAVLDAAGLDAMIAQQPRLAAALLASIARRLSLRVRQISARLSALA